MNKLDLFVKNGMLRHPRIFPRRIDVLMHAYVVLGNGYDWDRNGVLSSRGGGEYYRKTMDYSDLDRRENRADMKIVGSMQKIIGAVFAEQDEAERRRRKERFLRIDELASTPDTVTKLVDIRKINPRTTPTDELERDNICGAYYSGRRFVQYFEDGFQPIHYPPNIAEMPDEVEPSFLAGAFEIMDAYVRSEEEEDVRVRLIKARDKLKAKYCAV